MEYKKIINLLEFAPNQPIKVRSKNWVEINDESRGVCNTGSQIKIKTLMLRSHLCDCCYAYILVNGTKTIPKERYDNAAKWLDERNNFMHSLTA